MQALDYFDIDASAFRAVVVKHAMGQRIGTFFA